MDRTPLETRGAPERRRAALSLVELLVVIAIIGVLTAILLPAIQASREAARNSSCKNNLKQICAAIHLYHDAARRLPPAKMGNQFTVEPGPLFLILPYLEESATKLRFDAKASYQSTADNLSVVNTRVPVYLCPTMNLPRTVPDSASPCGEQGAPGSYAAATGTGVTFAPNVPSFNLPKHNGAIIHPKYGATTIEKISNADGTSETLMIGELNYGLKNYMWCSAMPGAVKWGETRWAIGYPGVTWASTVGRLNGDSLDTLLNGLFYAEFESFRSDHPGGVNFAFVDGSVRFMSEAIELRTLQALTTRDGGETIDPSAY